MGYLLKEALKTLCGVNQWSYAVFWKIGCQNPKLLILEEGYYEEVSWSGYPGFSGDRNPEIDFQARDKVHFLVNEMMTDSNVKTIGEGLVGRVAFTGNYQWILSESCYRESHPPEVLKEVYEQFSAGMQTVAVIPVLSHGVVQLGSYINIVEDIGFVNDVMSLVLQLGHIPGTLQPANYPPHTVYSTPRELSLESNTNNSASQNQFINGAVKAEVIFPSDSSSNGLKNLNLLKTETFVDPVDRLATENMLHAYDDNRKHKIEHTTDNTNYGDACMILSRSGDDLFDVLGADFRNELFNNSCSRNETGNNTSLEICPSNLDSGILSFSSTDQLLDAVVSKLHPNKSFNESVSCRTTLTSTSSPSGLLHGRFVDHTKGELLGIPKYVAKAKEDSVTYSAGSSCVYDPWAEKVGFNMKPINSVATGCSSKPQGPSKPSRKRLKPGENPRPRPKDRQMIQERVKELREIVPNSAKCSIDTLLERTIKHMLFLQGVTKHADKLKQTAESKIMSKDGDGLVLKDNSGGGATWAYEVGSQSMVCPIIVEDLNQPHQMLVEMLCEERGLFLEIADIIRGLGLTILKGLMENRDDKIWARFTVEANRNVTRMEIFLSLVRFLDQSAKAGVPQQPNSKNNNKMVQEFRQAASISATGGPVGIC